jgi:hypothetical protein
MTATSASSEGTYAVYRVTPDMWEEPWVRHLLGELPIARFSGLDYHTRPAAHPRRRRWALAAQSLLPGPLRPARRLLRRVVEPHDFSVFVYNTWALEHLGARSPGRSGALDPPLIIRSRRRSQHRRADAGLQRHIRGRLVRRAHRLRRGEVPERAERAGHAARPAEAVRQTRACEATGQQKVLVVGPRGMSRTKDDAGWWRA